MDAKNKLITDQVFEYLRKKYQITEADEKAAHDIFYGGYHLGMAVALGQSLDDLTNGKSELIDLDD